MTHGSLFSGIGGFDLAAEWMGWENVFHCEWNDFGKKVLNYYWPQAISYDDITKTDFTKHRGTIDVLSGGFPCQPYSVAGKRKGKADERHLWPEMLRAIGEIQPTYVVGENVSGLISWNGGLVFHEVQAELEAKGYEVQPFILPACAKNAPHRRDRVWFIAYAHSFRNNRAERSQNGIWQQSDKEQPGCRGTMQINGFGNERIITNPNGTKQGNNIGTDIGKKGEIRRGKESGVFGELSGDGNATDSESIGGCEGFGKDVDNSGWETSKHISKRVEIRDRDKAIGGTGVYTNSTSKGFQRSNGNNWENFPTQSPICGGNDGIPERLVDITFPKWRNESIKAFGNAIVPQVAFEIFKAIEDVNSKIIKP